MNERAAGVLFVNHVSHMYGAEFSMLDMVRCLDARRFAITAAVPAAGSLSSALEATGAAVAFLPLRRFRRTANPATLLSYAVSLCLTVPRLAFLIRRRRIGLVHANSNTAHLYAGPAAKLARVPCIWHCRDLVPLAPLSAWMSRTATRIVAISETVARHLRDQGVADRNVTVIRNAIDTDRFRPSGGRDAIRAELGIAPGVFVAAMAGQLVAWKTHGLFIDAAAEVHRAVPTARFLIVGDNPCQRSIAYRRRLEAQIHRLGLDSCVVFTGRIADMAALLEGVDVLVHPADREPFGRVVAEAMALAKPVVAVNAGGPAEILTDGVTGLLVPPNSSAELAAAVLKLAVGPELAARLGRNARKYAIAHLAMRDFRSKLEALYEEVLKVHIP